MWAMQFTENSYFLCNASLGRCYNFLSVHYEYPVFHILTFLTLSYSEKKT